jgi:hypothetical protein
MVHGWCTFVLNEVGEVLAPASALNQIRSASQRRGGFFRCKQAAQPIERMGVRNWNRLERIPVVKNYERNQYSDPWASRWPLPPSAYYRC